MTDNVQGIYIGPSAWKEAIILLVNFNNLSKICGNECLSNNQTQVRMELYFDSNKIHFEDNDNTSGLMIG